MEGEIKTPKKELECTKQMINSEREKNELRIQNLIQTCLTLKSNISENIAQKKEWEENTEIIKQLQEVKEMAKKLEILLECKHWEVKCSEDSKVYNVLKDELELLTSLTTTIDNENVEIIITESELIAIIQNVMQKFLTLKSKINEIIAQKKEVSLEIRTEVKNQFRQVKDKVDELESNNQNLQIIQFERDQIIQQLTNGCVNLERKLQNFHNSKKMRSPENKCELKSQLLKLKEMAEKLKNLLENQSQNTEIRQQTGKQLQEVKDAAENLKRQLESKNQEILQTEKMRNNETEKELQELVNQLGEKETEKNLNEVSQSSRGTWRCAIL
ncbi:spindle pole body component 110-like [Neolamprologus brichardi]|uniref:spindle pole body component 110-like n=1 Tax=Neolamprologus brichardi TaxID=32507 RepID=UPI001643CA76|nr:spindle pole body component 110-like [Neolamprologus brichardi]